MIEMTIPSSLDPTLAPTGHHVCLFFTQFTPYDIEGGWTPEATEAYADKIFNTVEEYAPGFKDSIVGKDVLTPPALHETFGLTGGNIFHGAMTLDQVFLTRPVADAKGRAAPSTPVTGLFLCGSGAHPGGGGRLLSFVGISCSSRLIGFNCLLQLWVHLGGWQQSMSFKTLKGFDGSTVLEDCIQGTERGMKLPSPFLHVFLS